jgi:hypothetical protein
MPVTKGVARKASKPHADKDWHPCAMKLWDATKQSGQIDFYQQSDWAMLYSLCDDLSYYKKQGRRSAQLAATIYSGLGNLLLTEADRRRARIELDLPVETGPTAGVVAIAEYKAAMEAAATPPGE